jgi:hypothetical protein
MASESDIYPANGHEYVYTVARRNTSTGVDEAAAGLTAIQAWLALTAGGASINAALTKTLAERASTPGEYFAVVSGADLTTYLPATGSRVYEVVNDGTNIKTTAVLTVRSVRHPA